MIILGKVRNDVLYTKKIREEIAENEILLETEVISVLTPTTWELCRHCNYVVRHAQRRKQQQKKQRQHHIVFLRFFFFSLPIEEDQQKHTES
jgi:hypothetical protein